MEKKKNEVFGVKLFNFIKKTDSFGTPVSMTYKNDRFIKSFIGGLFTVLARFGVIIFLLVQCLKVINREKVIQTAILKKDLSND